MNIYLMIEMNKKMKDMKEMKVKEQKQFRKE